MYYKGSYQPPNNGQRGMNTLNLISIDAFAIHACKYMERSIPQYFDTTPKKSPKIKKWQDKLYEFLHEENLPKDTNFAIKGVQVKRKLSPLDIDRSYNYTCNKLLRKSLKNTKPIT